MVSCTLRKKLFVVDFFTNLVVVLRAAGVCVREGTTLEASDASDATDATDASDASDPASGALDALDSDVFLRLELRLGRRDRCVRARPAGAVDACLPDASVLGSSVLGASVLGAVATVRGASVLGGGASDLVGDASELLPCDSEPSCDAR